MIQMQTVFPKALPTLPRLARFAAVALLALVAVPAVLTGLAQADNSPTVAFSQQTYTVDEGDLLEMDIRLSQALDEDLALVVATSDGTAASPEDYVAVSIPTTIHAGREQITFLLVTAVDDVEDDSETLTVSIQLAEGAPVKAGADATVTIREQPPAPVQNLTLEYEAGVDGEGPIVMAKWDAAPEPGQNEPQYNKAVRWIARIYVTDRPSDGKVRRPLGRHTRTSFYNLEPGETYTVWVRGVNKWGNKGERVHATITLPE